MLERLCARASRLFVFAHRLLAAYRRRLGEATSTSSSASEGGGGGGGGGGVGGGGGGVGVGGGGGDDEGVDRLKERLREALADLATERAARATAAARVVLEAELATIRAPDVRIPFVSTT